MPQLITVVYYSELLSFIGITQDIYNTGLHWYWHDCHRSQAVWLIEIQISKLCTGPIQNSNQSYTK